MAFAEEVAVFAETNLGTRIVIKVPLGITAADFKRELEKTHASCISSIGEIRVHGLMVKRKSRLFYLADSVPLKYIFRYNQKPWFIHAEASVVNGSREPSISNSIDKDQTRRCSASDTFNKVVIGLIQGENKKLKKSRAINLASGQTILDKTEFLGPSTIRSSLSVARSAETTSSECFNSFVPITPERKPGESVSISKKLIVAANNIRMRGKAHVSSSLSSSIFRSNTRRKRSLEGKTVSSLAKFLVFEISDTEG